MTFGSCRGFPSFHSSHSKDDHEERTRVGTLPSLIFVCFRYVNALVRLGGNDMFMREHKAHLQGSYSIEIGQAKNYSKLDLFEILLHFDISCRLSLTLYQYYDT